MPALPRGLLARDAAVGGRAAMLALPAHACGGSTPHTAAPVAWWTWLRHRGLVDDGLQMASEDGRPDGGEVLAYVLEQILEDVQWRAVVVDAIEQTCGGKRV